MRVLIVLAWVVAIAACGDRGTVRADVDASGNHWFHGTRLQVGVADDVGAWIDDTLVGRMPREVGATMPVPFEGRSCELAVVRTFTTQESDPQNERRKISREYKYDYYNGAELELRCADGPAPGAAGTLRGGSPRQALPWVVPALLLAFLAGFLWAGESTVGVAFAALGVSAVAAAAAVAIPLVRFADIFKLSIAALFVFLGAVAALAGAQWRVHPIASVAGLVAAVAGALGFGMRLAAWTFMAPFAAIGVAAGAWVVAMIVVLSIWPADEMEKRMRQRQHRKVK